MTEAEKIAELIRRARAKYDVPADISDVDVVYVFGGTLFWRSQSYLIAIDTLTDAIVAQCESLRRAAEEMGRMR